MSGPEARMAHEIAEAPQAVARQAAGLAQPIAELVARLKRRPPQVVVTCARGSSGHAATYAKHLIERSIGTPVAEAAPNIASVYGRRLNLKDQLFLAISQSGRSDDLIEMALSARSAGALTVALVNATDGPLTRACDIVLPIGAGPEQSVAASKTFVATVSAVQRLIAAWISDAALARAVDALPERLAEASALDWSEAVAALSRTTSLVTIGRGPTLAIAREASLKLKETCNLHAEAFSGAEFLHGPVALAAARYPIVMFMPNDQAAPGMRQLAADLRRKGAALLTAEPGDAAPGRLPALPARHPETDAVCLVQSFYAMLIRLADRLGLDVDRPRHLQKVTRTR
ncbi:MAG TPA: SIS domain-containing protein [Hyphomicrobiaceae bacterium]|jgi:glucosamine--fructose-6-phosphate aminotransferase (isomerizing)|nr:SIS domain-containing protein [Hyphomicrobiaceae bacterium]